MPILNKADRPDLRGASLYDVAGDQFNTFKTYTPSTEEGGTLAALKPADRRGYDVPRCMEGTRQSVFERIDSWLDDYKVTVPNILWISGSPGAGKSAIASSLISELAKRRRLGCYFFFKRGDASLGDPSILWRTVAADLSRFHPSIKDDVVEFLSRPGFRDADIRLHFDCMIEEPLTKYWQKLSTAPPVIVLDALDECGSDESAIPQRRVLLETLTRWTRLPRSIKLIVTSRDERVPKSFHDERFCHHIALETGDSVSDETGKDIRIFFEKSFGDIKPKLGLSSAWPGELAMDRLTERAAGLFIWAKTAMAFMEEEHGVPDTRLRSILAGKLGRGTDNIDSLYQHILDFYFKKSNDNTYELFRAVVGAITVAKTPLHRDDLTYFLGRGSAEDERQFNIILHGLSSVVSKGELDGLLRLRHWSFAEFLGDTERCRDPRFIIDRNEQCRHLTLACFRILKAELRFNICRLETSYTSNDDVKDLSSRIATMIPMRLLYSCRFWAAHLRDTTIDEHRLDALLQAVEDFLYVRLLYWLEVMSLIKEVPASSIALLTAARWIERYSPTLSDFARDASRFVANFYTPISESAPHIYLSALPFSPQESLVSKQFMPLFPQTLSVVTGREKHWPALINVLTDHMGGVNSVGFSPDGKRVVSGSNDRMVRVWDVETGQIVAGPFEGHRDRIWSVQFSPDGKRVVSGSEDGTICIWDVESGHIVSGPFQVHFGSVNSVGFSPDGKWVISGSSDKTVRIWDAETGQIESCTFEGHTRSVRSADFAPDGKRAVSSSADKASSSDKSICLWDVETGQTIAGPFEGHTDGVRSVRFSPDGKLVVSGSDDETVRVWDVKTGQVVGGPFKGHMGRVSTVRFSPDGKRVASGSTDKRVRLWDIETGQIAAGPFEGHTGGVRSIGFSPDGKRVVSGSDDETVCVWDVESGHVVRSTFQGHADWVNSVGFAPDGKRVVSGSNDEMVCVWDVETGLITAGPFEGHKGGVRSVRFLFDGKRVVSGSDNGTVCVWDIDTGHVVARTLGDGVGSTKPLAFSHDGKRVVLGYNKTISVWDIETGHIVVGPFNGHAGMVLSVAFSHDGRRIVSGSDDKTIYICDVQTGQIVAGPFRDHIGAVNSVGFSPNGTAVASGSDNGTVCIWDVQTGQIAVGPFGGHRGCIMSVGFSPDGRLVVSGSDDKIVRVWDANTGQIVGRPLRGHKDWVRSVGFSPDGRKVVSGSDDGTIRVWDINISQITTGSRPPDGEILSDFDDKEARVWHNNMGAFDKSHLAALLSIGSRDRCSNGWTNALDPQGKRIDHSLLFWVPSHCRLGMCEVETIVVMGARMTRLDLSRFVHGTSWTDCHPYPCTDVPRLLRLPKHNDSSTSEYPVSEHNPESSLALQLDNLTSRHMAFLLAPLVAVYYYHFASQE